MTSTVLTTDLKDGESFWEGAKRLINDFPVVALDLAKKKADEKGLTGFRRYVFVTYEQMRLGDIKKTFAEAALIRHAMDFHEDTPIQLLEKLAYSTPSVRNAL